LSPTSVSDDAQIEDYSSSDTKNEEQKEQRIPRFFNSGLKKVNKLDLQSPVFIPSENATSNDDSPNDDQNPDQSNPDKPGLTRAPADSMGNLKKIKTKFTSGTEKSRLKFMMAGIGEERK